MPSMDELLKKQRGQGHAEEPDHEPEHAHHTSAKKTPRTPPSSSTSTQSHSSDWLKVLWLLAGIVLGAGGMWIHMRTVRQCSIGYVCVPSAEKAKALAEQKPVVIPATDGGAPATHDAGHSVPATPPAAPTAKPINDQYHTLKSNKPDGNSVAFTIDDGTCGATDEVLALLHKFGVKATFFVMGSSLDNPKCARSARRILAEGHEIAAHGWVHEDMPMLAGKKVKEGMTREDADKAVVQEQVTATLDKIEQVTGFRPNMYRAPGGHLSAAQIKLIADQGIYIVHWSVDSADARSTRGHDGKEADAREILDNIMGPDFKMVGGVKFPQAVKVTPTDIILVHSAGGTQGRVPTMQALTEAIPKIAKAGMKFVTLSQGLPGITPVPPEIATKCGEGLRPLPDPPEFPPVPPRVAPATPTPVTPPVVDPPANQPTQPPPPPAEKAQSGDTTGTFQFKP